MNKINKCGPCTECCWVLKVPEKNKGLWQDCPHRNLGCEIYASRPESCREYVCLFISDDLPEEYRPDKMRAIVSLFKHAPKLLVIHAWEPYVWTQMPLRHLITKMRQAGYDVEIKWGEPGKGTIKQWQMPKRRKGMIKKLVVEEFTITEKDHEPERLLPVGSKYAYFKDPETGKLYRPAKGFTVTGDDLSDRFMEVKE